MNRRSFPVTIVNWLLCKVLGHRDEIGFWETRCKRCDRIKRDRLYHYLDVDSWEYTFNRILVEEARYRKNDEA